MNKTASVSLRLLGIIGLGVLLAVTVPLSWILQKASGGSLWIAEWAKAEFLRLWGAGK